MAKRGVLWLASLAGPRAVGGLGVYARGLGRELSNAGWDITHLKTNAPASPLPDCEETIDVPIRSAARSPLGSVLENFGPRLASRPSLHRLLQWLAERGLRIDSASRHGSAPTVVHFIGTGWDFAGFAFLRAARESGALFTVLPAVHPDSWGDDVIDLRFYKQTDAVFCLSEHERRHLAALGVPESKLVRTVLPPMCRTDGDRDKFRTLHNLGERPVILFMGRRDEGKGYPAVLRAWVEVLRQIPSAVLCLAGPRGSEFAHLLTELPADSYRDLGVPGEMEKADALAGCDVFCLPSAHESFGIVYLEAWVYGKPAVCGTAPASRELVEHQRTGLHLSQDPEELAVALSSLLTKPALAHALGAAGLAEQGQRFTMNAMIDDHLRTWRSRSAS